MRLFKRRKKEKKMKLAVSYNLFDGEELLEASINSIREEADYINVVYQTTSYYGEKCSDGLVEYLQNLKNKGLIDELYHFEFTDATEKHDLERQKRDIGLKLAKHWGATHFMSMDVDEFYDKDELGQAKQFILDNNIESSAACVLEYLKEPEYQIQNGYTFGSSKSGFYVFYVPFIMKVFKLSSQKHGKRYFPCLVDPTRALNSKKKFYLFPSQQVMMHHMSTVRINLKKKYNNSNLLANNDINNKNEIMRIQKEVLEFDFNMSKSNSKDFAFLNKLLLYKVPNKFNIDISNFKIT